ncbi:MAG: hypothetical protein ACLP01_13445 [Solirubrobacteraceae bacterium]
MVDITRSLARAQESVEDFRGGYEQLAAMMRDSWAQSTAPPYLYTGELLQDCFRYPGADFSLAPCIYDGDGPVAFVAGWPRTVRFGGGLRRVLICAMLTVSREQRASGYGIVVWSELMRRASRSGFDGVVSYCEHDGPMDAMVPASCRLLGLPVLRAASFSYLTRMLPERDGRRSERSAGAGVKQLLEAASSISGDAGLARLWSPGEAAWQLSRLGGLSVSAETGGDPAVLTAYLIAVADTAHTTYLVIEDVLWGEQPTPLRAALVRGLIDRAIDRGARYAVLPMLGYADLQPFLAAGFLPSAHTLHAYLTVWTHGAPDRAPDGFYLDVA